MATGFNSVTVVRRINAYGSRVFGSAIWGGHKRSLLTRFESDAPGYRQTCAMGFHHIGQRMFGRPVRIEVPSIDTGNGTDDFAVTFGFSDGGTIGTIRSDNLRTIVKSLEFVEDAYGSADGKLTLRDLPPFEIQPGAIVRIYYGIGNVPKYIGQVTTPNLRGTRRDEYVIDFEGLYQRLRKIKNERTYPPGEDIGEIVDDLVRYEIVTQSAIGYSASKINTSTGKSNVSTLDIHTDDMVKVMDSLALAASGGGAQYEWFVDTEGDFNFRVRPNSLQNLIPSGYASGKVEITKDQTQIVNSWTVTRRAQKGSGQNGWSIVTIVDDETSEALNGEVSKTYQVPGYFDDDTCELIGEALLAQTKDAPTAAKISDVNLRAYPELFPRGLYRIVLPYDVYEETLTQNDDSSEWTLVGTGLTKSTSTTSGTFQSGAASLRLDWTNTTARVQTNDGVIDFVGSAQRLLVTMRVSRTGTRLRFGIGRSAWDDYTVDIPVPVASRFYVYQWDLTGLDVRKIGRLGIEVIDTTGEATTAYIDAVRIVNKTHKHYDLLRQRARYSFGPGELKGTIEFGSVPKRLHEFVSGAIALAEEARLSGEIR